MALSKLVLILASTLSLIAASAGLAVADRDGDAYTTDFVCPDGERLRVDWQSDTARLRSGYGVFSLKADEEGSYRGAGVRMSVNADILQFERADARAAIPCRQVRQAT